jgi:hypothetical protein
MLSISAGVQVVAQMLRVFLVSAYGLVYRQQGVSALLIATEAISLLLLAWALRSRKGAVLLGIWLIPIVINLAFYAISPGAARLGVYLATLQRYYFELWFVAIIGVAFVLGNFEKATKSSLATDIGAVRNGPQKSLSLHVLGALMLAFYVGISCRSAIADLNSTYLPAFRSAHQYLTHFREDARLVSQEKDPVFVDGFVPTYINGIIGNNPMPLSLFVPIWIPGARFGVAGMPRHEVENDGHIVELTE